MKKLFKSLSALDWAMLMLCVVLIVFLMVLIIRLANTNISKDESCSEEIRVEDTPMIEEDAVPYFEVIDDVYREKEIGRCRLTVYTPHETHHGYNTATGNTSMHLMTCAVDPEVIPYGSNVIITDKDGEEWRFKAIDYGNFSGNWIDIFFEGTERQGIEWLDEVFAGEFGEVRIEVPVK